jgi:hypothetical protein
MPIDNLQAQSFRNDHARIKAARSLHEVPNVLCHEPPKSVKETVARKREKVSINQLLVEKQSDINCKCGLLLAAPNL